MSFYLVLDASRISHRPSSKVFVEGENVTLHCNATGNPAPNITWTKDGSSTVLYQGETYSIVNIQRQATGHYTCTVWNGVGGKTNVTATVTVQCEFVYFNLLIYNCRQMSLGQRVTIANSNIRNES